MQRFSDIRRFPRTKFVVGLMSAINSSTLFLHAVKQNALKMPLLLKQHSFNIVRMCTQQCECVIAHRVRRGQQIVSLYSRMWDEMALNLFIKTLQRQIMRQGKVFILSAVAVATLKWDWDKERITDDEIFRHLDEIEYIHRLRDDTMTCHICHLRQVVSAPLPNVVYCQCKTTKKPSNKTVNDWLPFIEGEDLLVWRKEKEKDSGLFSYKVYGSYNDVTAEDFLQVQLDVESRQDWDPTAVQLHVIDSDPSTNSDVVYWELEWPRLFANRDYVFNRRYIVDREKKVMLIVNQCTSHPSCPARPENHRVVDYWSFMVIRPYTEFNQPGLEFGLTYFDNPGISIPSAVTAWVAMSGLPHFLQRLRVAAREVGLKRQAVAVFEEPVELEESEDEVLISSQPNKGSSTSFHQESQNKLHNSTNSDSYCFKELHLRQLFL